MAKKYIKIQKEEFCERTHSNPNGWIFKELGKDHRFFKDDNQTYLDDGNGNVYRFKNMEKYGEIWMSIKEQDGNWSIWDTWTVY